MEPITMRTLTPSDKPAYLRLMAQAFSRGSVAAENDSVWDESFGPESTGIWSGDSLQASVTIRPFTVHWPGSRTNTLSLGGVAGVATSVEGRGRGYVDRLLRDALVRMREAGQMVSALYPFAWAFYRRYGWEWVGEKRSLTVPLRELKSTAEGRFVRDVTGDSAENIIKPIYDKFAASYRGVFSLDSHQWSDRLQHNDGRTTYVYAYFPDGGTNAEAYLLWRYDRDGDAGEVREFVATSVEGYRALYGLLHYFGTQCRSARITVPDDAPYLWHLCHNDQRVTVEPTFQARVVDVCAAISACKGNSLVPIGSQVTVAIEDDVAPWNNGTFTLINEGDRINCAADTSRAVDVTLDIQAFSQAFWGNPSLSRLRMAGRLKVTGESGYETLLGLLPASPVWTLDSF